MPDSLHFEASKRTPPSIPSQAAAARSSSRGHSAKPKLAPDAMATIDWRDSTRVIVGFATGAEHLTTWVEYVEANPDLGEEALSEILRTVARGHTYRGDSGAGGRWTIRRADVAAPSAEAVAPAPTIGHFNPTAFVTSIGDALEPIVDLAKEELRKGADLRDVAGALTMFKDYTVADAAMMYLFLKTGIDGGGDRNYLLYEAQRALEAFVCSGRASTAFCVSSRAYIGEIAAERLSDAGALAIRHMHRIDIQDLRADHFLGKRFGDFAGDFSWLGEHLRFRERARAIEEWKPMDMLIQSKLPSPGPVSAISSDFPVDVSSAGWRLLYEAEPLEKLCRSHRELQAKIDAAVVAHENACERAYVKYPERPRNILGRVAGGAEDDLRPISERKLMQLRDSAAKNWGRKSSHYSGAAKRLQAWRDHAAACRAVDAEHDVPRLLKVAAQIERKADAVARSIVETPPRTVGEIMLKLEFLSRMLGYDLDGGPVDERLVVGLIQSIKTMLPVGATARE